MRVRIMCTISVCVSSASMNQPDWNSAWLRQAVRAEDVPHHAERGDVEDRADRPDEDHEPPDVARRPTCAACSGSPRPCGRTGSPVCEKSYSRFCTRSCTGSIGRNGRNALATSTLNTLPKFELAVILMYLMMLPKVARPSTTPSSSTSRLFSSRMMSADFLGDVDRRIDRDADVRRLAAPARR